MILLADLALPQTLVGWLIFAILVAAVLAIALGAIKAINPEFKLPQQLVNFVLWVVGVILIAAIAIVGIQFLLSLVHHGNW